MREEGKKMYKKARKKERKKGRKKGRKRRKDCFLTVLLFLTKVHISLHCSQIKFYIKEPEIPQKLNKQN